MWRFLRTLFYRFWTIATIDQLRVRENLDRDSFRGVEWYGFCVRRHLDMHSPY